MKKILSILLLISSFSYSQTLLKPSQIDGGSTLDQILITKAPAFTTTRTAVPTFSTLSSLGILQGSLTANYIPYAVSSTSLTNSPFYTNNNFIGLGTTTPTVQLDIVNTNTNIAIFNNTRLARLKSSSVASLINFEGSSSSVSVGTSTSGSPCLFCVVNEADGNHLLKLQGGSNNFIDGRSTFETTNLQYSYIDTKNTQSWSSFGARLTQPFHIYDNIANKFVFSIDNNGDTHLNQDYGKTYANGVVNLNTTTANSLLYSNGSKDVTSVVLGSGLSLSSGTLSATSSGSTTILTASTNITISGSAPNYTISTPTQTTGLASTSSPTITSPTFSTSSNYNYATASRVPIFDGSKNLVSSSTTTTELTYLAGVTSSVQTQLDAKLSSTKERLLTTCGFAITNPADATSYYFGEYTDAVPQTSQGIYKFQFNENLTVTRVVITVKHVTNPTNESVSFYLRASSTTDQTITTSMDMSTVGASTSKVFVYSGLSLSVTSGTDYELKMLTPTWATNPTSTTIRVKIYGY